MAQIWDNPRPLNFLEHDWACFGRLMKDNTSRRWAILVLVCGLMLSATAAWLLYYSEQKRLHDHFVKELADRSGVLARELNSSFETLYTLGALFVADDTPDAAVFDHIAGAGRKRHKDIVAYYWFPSETVANAPLNASYFNGLDSFQLQAGPADGLLGRFRQSISEAAKTDQVALAVERREGEAAQRQPEAPSLIVASLSIPDIRNPGQKKGYIVALVNLQTTFNDAINRVAVTGIDLKLWDQTRSDEPVLLHYHQSRMKLETDISRSSIVPMFVSANREWFLEGLPAYYYFSSKVSWLPQFVFSLGAMLTTLIYLGFRRSARQHEIIRSETIQLLSSNQELEAISRTDALTGVANRRYFDEVLDKEWKRALRTSSPVTLIMADIDCFKQFNDYYGHLEGDECIRRVAKVLYKMMSRPMDLVARYGGEEFAILLPDTNENAISLAQECCKAVEQQQIAHAASKVSPFVTVSMGIATMTFDRDSDVSDLIRLADRALYSAKAGGRNQVVQAASLEGEAPLPSDSASASRSGLSS